MYFVTPPPLDSPLMNVFKYLQSKGANLVTTEDCPKCGNDLIKPVYHTNCISAKKYPDLIIRQNMEHLHYFCTCGYDFIKKVKNGEAGDK